MAIDLSLAIVPTQVERLFDRANWDREYAELICFVPCILKRPDFFGDRSTRTDLEFERDVLELKQHREYSQEDLYYDTMRGSATLDWLFAKAAEARGIHGFPYGFLRSGDDHIAKVVSKLAVATQGIAVRYYDRPRLEAIFRVLDGLEFDHLMRFYDYEEMYRENVYRLAEPSRIDFLRDNFGEVVALFKSAQQDENTYVLQVLD